MQTRREADENSPKKVEKLPLGPVLTGLFDRLDSSSWATLFTIASQLVSWGIVGSLKFEQQKLQAGAGASSTCPPCNCSAP